jgi:hypothetical protein
MWESPYLYLGLSLVGVGLGVVVACEWDLRLRAWWGR